MFRIISGIVFLHLLTLTESQFLVPLGMFTLWNFYLSPHNFVLDLNQLGPHIRNKPVMKFSSSLFTVLAMASAAVCSTVPVSRSYTKLSLFSMPLINCVSLGASSCKPSDRVIVKSRNVTSPDGHEIQIATKACSADAIKATRDLEKRQVINVDVDGTIQTMLRDND